MDVPKRRPENPCKRYVKVRADHDLDGKIRPLMFREEDGAACRIDRIMDVGETAALKAGGQGMRYVCQVEGKTIYLFNDEPYWFIEQDAPQEGQS